MDQNYRSRNFGVAPRAIDYLFQRLRDKTRESTSPFYIRVSYCEIYNEQVRREKEKMRLFSHRFV